MRLHPQVLSCPQPQPSRTVADDVGDGLDEVVASVLEHRAAVRPPNQPRATPDQHRAVGLDEDPERFAAGPALRGLDRVRPNHRERPAVRRDPRTTIGVEREHVHAVDREHVPADADEALTAPVEQSTRGGTPEHAVGGDRHVGHQRRRQTIFDAEPAKPHTIVAEQPVR
jgi:hypothetical protein